MKKLLRRFTSRLSPTSVVVLSFAAIIVAGALALSLPFATRGNGSCGLLTAFFTATSATCVTGLQLYDTYTYWSSFGQGIILLLIQIGGLGFMTLFTILSFATRRKIGLRERLIMMQSLNLADINGVVRMVRRVLFGTLLFEGIGTIILTICFTPHYGFVGGLARGVFHSVSSFCNAGIDIFGEVSRAEPMNIFAREPVPAITACVLMVIGSLGFVVWDDIYIAIKERHIRHFISHTRIVLVVTAALIVFGTAAYAMLEWNNPGTLGRMDTGNKLLTSVFLSVSQRTAGFSAVDQRLFSDGSKALTMLFMFIGGSPGSTAGGAKTVVLAILLVSSVSALRGKSDTNIFKRSVTSRQVRNCAAVVMLLLTLCIFGTVMLILVDGLPASEAAFEVTSAVATTGLTLGTTPTLHIASKLLLTLYMFIGKIGLMTLGVSTFTKPGEKSLIRYPEAQIMIG